MAKKVAQITAKIVEFTGNEDTRKFIGRPVTLKKTTNGLVYAIGDTGYVLTSDEFKMFVAAGAIAQPKSTKQAKASGSEQLTAQEIKDAQKGANIDAIIADEKERAKTSKKEKASRAATPKHQRILASSSFLQNYQTPDFELDTPKHIGFMDRGEELGQKLTGFFDRIGRKGKDKIIDSMK